MQYPPTRHTVSEQSSKGKKLEPPLQSSSWLPSPMLSEPAPCFQTSPSQAEVAPSAVGSGAAGCGRLWERGENSPKGPARPVVQTKLRPRSGVFPVQPTGDREPGPPHVRPHEGPALKLAEPGVRAAASARHGALASGPRGPFLSRPGRRAARNKGAAAAAPAASPLPAHPARSP